VTWDNDAFRGCGMVVDWLRDRWFYASLVVLRDQPQTPTELLGRFQAARKTNVAVFGPYSVYPESITRHLGTLARAGLIEAGPLRERRREYAPTALGLELLDSLDAARAYSRDRHDWLVRCARIQQHMNPCAPIPMRSPGDSDAAAEERLRRRATALLFGTLLGPKWTFATMAALTRGPLRPYRIIAVVNGAVAASPDVVSGHLADSILAARLDALQRTGLVIRIPAAVGRRTSYGLTLEGYALMEALEPVAAFGIARDAEMTAAVKAM
jgi:DNA-binding HxlR family transcriptional regulator